MNNKIIVFFLTITTVSIFFCCKSNKALFDETIQSESLCAQKNGYWYEGKCWSDFEEEGIATSKIDSVVAEQMASIESSTITINAVKYPIAMFFPEMDGKELIFITVYEDEEGAKTIIQSLKLKQMEKEVFSAPALLLAGNVMTLSEDEAAMKKAIDQSLGQGTLKGKINDFDLLDIVFEGVLTNEKTGKNYQINYRSNEDILGAGTSTVEVKENEIHINGELGTRTYQQLKTVIKNYPNIKTVVLGRINGSLNDEVNMHTGRILRAAGLTTKVLKNSKIASGGVDLFCAGKERIIEKGAKLGIHSWCCFDDLTAAELPKEHPAHQYQRAYFTEMLGKEKGVGFYFYTLKAAPFDGVHWMTEEEITDWGLRTSD